MQPLCVALPLPLALTLSCYRTPTLLSKPSLQCLLLLTPDLRPHRIRGFQPTDLLLPGDLVSSDLPGPQVGAVHTGDTNRHLAKMEARLLPKAHVAPHGPALLMTSLRFTSHLLVLIFCAPDSQAFPLFLQNSTHSLPQGLCT